MVCIYEYDGLDVKFNISMGNMTLTQNNNYQIFTNNIRLKVGNNQYVINKLQEIYSTILNDIKGVSHKKLSKLIIYNGDSYMIFYNAIIQEMTVDFNSYTNNDIDMNIIYDYMHETIDFDVLKRREKIEKLLNRINYEKV